MTITPSSSGEIQTEPLKADFILCVGTSLSVDPIRHFVRAMCAREMGGSVATVGNDTKHVSLRPVFFCAHPDAQQVQKENRSQARSLHYERRRPEKSAWFSNGVRSRFTTPSSLYALKKTVVMRYLTKVTPDDAPHA